jgi:hypothetical protein
MLAGQLHQGRGVLGIEDVRWRPGTLLHDLLGELSSSPFRTVTWMPVCFSNALTSACVVCSCCPLYRISPLAGASPPLPAPHAAADAVSIPAATAVPITRHALRTSLTSYGWLYLG